MNQNISLRELVKTVEELLPNSVPLEVKKWKKYWEVKFDYDLEGEYIDLPTIYGYAVKSGLQVSFEDRDMFSDNITIIIKPKGMVNFNK